MKALSVRAPWWWMILEAGKRTENRDWQSPPRAMIGETFLLHASAWWSTPQVHEAFLYAKEMAREEDWARVQAMPKPLTLAPMKADGGKIVGRARLANVVRNGPMPTDGWAVSNALGFILADVERIAEPIPFKGALGFFEVPDAILEGATWERCAP